MDAPVPELPPTRARFCCFCSSLLGLAAAPPRSPAAPSRRPGGPGGTSSNTCCCLAVAVRFIQFSVYQSEFLSLHYYLVDATVCLIAGLLSFRIKRVQQMVTSYGWINRRAGPLRWRARY